MHNLEFYGIGTMLSLGLMNALSKTPSEKVDSILFVFFRGLISSLILFFLLIFYGQISFTFRSGIASFFIIVLGYFGMLSFFKALKLGYVGLVTPVANTRLIYTLILAFFILDSRISTLQFLSIVLILLGIVLISFKRDSTIHLSKSKSWILYALLTSVLWGFCAFLRKYVSADQGYIFSSFIIEFGIFLVSLFHIALSRKTVTVPDKFSMVNISLVALFAVLSTLFMNAGIIHYDVGIIATYGSASPLIAVLFSFFVYKEHMSGKQVLSVVFILIGTVLLSL